MSPEISWRKEKNTEALGPAEDEFVSWKQISTSPEDLSDYLAGVTGAEAMVRDRTTP